MSSQVVLEDGRAEHRVALGRVAARPSGAHPATRSARHQGLRAHRAALLVLLVGAVVTAVLTWAVTMSSDRTEVRLLRTQVRQGAAVLQLDAGVLQRPLAAGSELAVTDRHGFLTYAASQVGTTKGFRSISLWRRHGATYVPVAARGPGYVPSATTPGVQAMLASAGRTHELGVLALYRHRPPELVYGFVAVAGGGQLAAVGTQPLPRGKVIHPSPSSAFAELNYAIYFGSRADPAHLIFATTRQLPLAGSAARALVPFGDATLLLVATSVGWLGGPLAEWLPVGLAIAGSLLTLAVALLVERVVRRRREAERLAEEVGRLYGEQRGLAETLQQALLPDPPVPPPGLEVAVRYAAGAAGVEVGGDWYDVVPLENGRMLAVVGDVSGRGVDAARVMAALRFGLRAYAAEGESLPVLVGKVAGLLDVVRDGHFATLLALVVDVAERRCEVVNAGHLSPLVLSGEGAHFLATKVAPPIGVTAAPYEASTHRLPQGATLLAFTDGLVERRSDSLDDGLEALAAVAAGHRGDLDSLVGTVLRELASDGGDDTAILALRWRP